MLGFALGIGILLALGVLPGLHLRLRLRFDGHIFAGGRVVDRLLGVDGAWRLACRGSPVVFFPGLDASASTSVPHLPCAGGWKPLFDARSVECRGIPNFAVLDDASPERQWSRKMFRIQSFHQVSTLQPHGRYVCACFVPFDEQDCRQMRFRLMTEFEDSTDLQVRALREREKELRCLYAIEATFNDRSQSPVDAFHHLLALIPSGWQHPASTSVRITYLGRRHVGEGFDEGAPALRAALRVHGTELGELEVSDPSLETAEGFLDEERLLLRQIASRVGEFLEHKHGELMGARPRTQAHWAWRERFVEALARRLHPSRFGVARIFVGGSTASGDAGPSSDIDLVLVFEGTDEQRAHLEAWLEGWSLCLAEFALTQTGQPFPSGILDVTFAAEAPSLARRPDLRELELAPS